MLSLVVEKFNLFKNRETTFQFFVLWAILFFVYFSCSTAYKDVTDKGKYTVPVASGIVTERKYEHSDNNENNYYLKPKKNINKKEYLKLLEASEIIYDNYEEIINKGIKINI